MANPLPAPPPNPTILPQELWSHVKELLEPRFEYRRGVMECAWDEKLRALSLDVVLCVGRLRIPLKRVDYSPHKVMPIPPSREQVEKWFERDFGERADSIYLGGDQYLVTSWAAGNRILLQWIQGSETALILESSPYSKVLFRDLAEQICMFLSDNKWV